MSVDLHSTYAGVRGEERIKKAELVRNLVMLAYLSRHQPIYQFMLEYTRP